MNFVYYVVLLIVISMSALLSGCGAGGTSPETKNTLHESTACISCHQDRLSSVTGESIVAEWKRSSHMTANGAGCADCHDDGYMHPESCSKCHTIGGQSKNPTNNPDRDGKCVKCHNISNTKKTYNTSRDYNGIITDTLIEHFSNPALTTYTSSSKPYNARYVTKNFEKSCRSCHNPHDTSSNMVKLRQWARSGKGDVTALPWANYDFGRDPSRSTTTLGATPANSFGADCVRCHTTTGYINYLSNQSIAPAYGNTSRTEGKETLACNACHIDYSYARRPIGQITAFYNKSTVNNMRIRIAQIFPDIGASNLCLNCHVGRESGRIIKELANSAKTPNKVITPIGVYSFANTGFENSHYLTAGATIFKTSGFEFYSSQYYDNPSFYAHDKIGVANFNNSGTSGPCITCHMKPGNHTFLPVVNDSKDKSNARIIALTSTTCNNALCHNGSFSPSGIEIEHEKDSFKSAMDALKALLQESYSIYFYNANPYFFKSAYNPSYIETFNNLPSPTNCTQNQVVKNWQTHGTTSFSVTTNATTRAKSCRSTTIIQGDLGSGKGNMGAAFNYNLLYHDYGAFAHNRFYTKRLIYDSISWLYDNNYRTTTNIDGYYSDVEAAIQSLSSLTAQQKIDACNYLFNSSTYTYSSKSPNNWRPGSSASNPVY